MKKYTLILPSIILASISGFIGSTYASEIEDATNLPPDFSGSLEHHGSLQNQSGTLDARIMATLPSNIQSELQAMRTRHQTEMQTLIEKQRSEMKNLLTDYPDVLTKMQNNTTKKNTETVNKTTKTKNTTTSTTINQSKRKTIKERVQQQKTQSTTAQ